MGISFSYKLHYPPSNPSILVRLFLISFLLEWVFPAEQLQLIFAAFVFKKVVVAFPVLTAYVDKSIVEISCEFSCC